MIIKYPTALYDTVLPQGLDAGNVTWTISSEDPPRSDNPIQEIPLIAELTPLPDKIYDKADIRSVLGDLVYSVSEGNSSTIGSIKKQYEIGEILEFTNTEVDAVETDNVPNQIDLQQNTNLLDFESLGLSNDDINNITSTADSKMDELITQINDLKGAITGLKVDIVEAQKGLNESNKAIEAIKLIDVDQSILEKLVEKKTLYEQEIVLLTNQVNSLNIVVDIKYNELLKIREVVR